MQYNIVARPTLYAGVKFRSRLEARWAAFFDLIGWEWEYEPVDLIDWIPDFYVKFTCSHSECYGYHDLFVEIKPYFSIKEFEGHPATKYFYGKYFDEKKQREIVLPRNACASACFGNNPSVVEWEMTHGAGGGIETDIQFWTKINVISAWKAAGNAVQYIVRR